MNETSIKILLIEDNPGDARLIQEMLKESKKGQHTLVCADRLLAGLEHMARQEPDIILLDLGLPDSQGLDTLDKLLNHTPVIPVIVLTGLDDEATGLVAVQNGAQDYLIKGQINNKALVRTIQYAIERKKAAEELRKFNIELEARVLQRTAELEAVNKEMEAFSYSVSHDLRAPLRGIDAWSQILLQDYKDILDEKGQQYLNRIRSDTQRMGRLIDDLLTFSRQAHVAVRMQQLNMSEIVQNIVSRLNESYPGRLVEYIIQPGVVAQGDAHLIEIALFNLLDNSVKFTSKNDHSRIEFGETEKDGKVAYFVRDNGVGFDMKYASKLFGVFQRLHKESEFPGTGIGLATVQRLINRHGGRIWAESQVNEGATFYFIL